MTRRLGIAAVLLGLVAFDWRAAAQQTPDWGSGVAPFAFALIGDMPYGAIREAPFARLVTEINRDNDVDFVMHAGDIKAGSERCDDSLIQHRFDQYQAFQRAFIYTPGDNEWTDCHRVNNGSTTRSSGWRSCGRCSFRARDRRPGDSSDLYDHRLTAVPTRSSSKT